MNYEQDLNAKITAAIRKLEVIEFPRKGNGEDSVLVPSPSVTELFKIVTNSKYRRTALDNESILDINAKLNHAIESYSPIEFSVPFGGYKNYRIKSFPEIDWAEVFNIRYLIDYLIPIALSYPPGVLLNYSYNSQIATILNNMPLEYQKIYENSFLKIVEYFNQMLPVNFKIRVQQINLLYDNNEWQTEFEEHLNRNYNQWETLYDSVTREKKIQSAKHNLMLKGVRDLSQLSPTDLQKEYLKAAMVCDAIDSLSKRRKFNKYSNRIQLVFIRGPKPSIHIGVCPGSSMHFWVGYGLLEISKEKLIPKILSFEQLCQCENSLTEFSVESIFKNFSKNFTTMPIIK